MAVIVTWNEGLWTQELPEEEGIYFRDSFSRTENEPALLKVFKSGEDLWAFAYNGKPFRVPDDSSYWLGPITPPVGPINWGTAVIDEED